VSGHRRALKRRVTQVTNSLGLFTNYPQLVHGLARLTVEAPRGEIQFSIIKALRQFNGDKRRHSFHISGHRGDYPGELGFEVGVADGLYFYYLDTDAENLFTTALSKKRSFDTLDFLFVVTYHYARDGRMNPLRFDYHHLRFRFRVGGFEICLFHSKGIRRLPLDEVMSTILAAIKEEFQLSGIAMVDAYRWSL
jgi:hypothetical protein